MQMTMVDKEMKKFMNLQHTRKSLFSFCFNSEEEIFH